MRISSNLLGEAAAAAKRGTNGLFEAEMEVPPLLRPVISLRNNLRTANPAGATQCVTTTYAEDNKLVTNAGLASSLFLTLGPGLWELNIDVMYSSNYPSTNNGWDLQVNLVSVTAFNLIRAFSALVAGGTVDIARTVLISTDGVLTFTSIMNANAAGQTHGAHVGILASLLV